MIIKGDKAGVSTLSSQRAGAWLAKAAPTEAEKLTGVKRALASALGPEFTKKIKEEFGQLNEKELALSVIENVKGLTQANLEIFACVKPFTFSMTDKASSFSQATLRPVAMKV